MSPQAPVLIGYRYSVYSRVARIVLAEKGIAHDWVEFDPFAQAGGAHPFGRVPLLRHGDFAIYETAAITAYVDEAFDGPALMPEGAKARARAVQVIGIVDFYAYWPLVRQVYSHAVFQPAFGEAGDAAEVAAGMRVAPRVLAALEEIAAEGLVLAEAFGRAEAHLAPMIAAFAQAREGAEMLAGYPALSGWWRRVKIRKSIVKTTEALTES